MPAESISELRKAAGLSNTNPWTLAALGQAYAHFGQDDEARRLLGQLLQMPDSRSRAPADIAFLYGALGMKEESFAWLEKAYEERSGSLILLRVDTIWEPLRSDPRFNDFILRVGIPGCQQTRGMK